MLRLEQNILRGFFWCPKDRDVEVIQCLQAFAIKNNVAAGQIHEEAPPRGFSPPTHFRTNSFTQPFQVRFCCKIQTKIFNNYCEKR